MYKFFLVLFSLSTTTSVPGTSAHAGGGGGGGDYRDRFGPRAVTLWRVIFNNPDACPASRAKTPYSLLLTRRANSTARARISSAGAICCRR